jgi:hypothetical protein
MQTLAFTVTVRIFFVARDLESFLNEMKSVKIKRMMKSRRDRTDPYQLKMQCVNWHLHEEGAFFGG